MNNETPHKLTEEEKIQAWRKAAEGCCGEGKIVWPKTEEDIVQAEELAVDPAQAAANYAELSEYLQKEKDLQTNASQLKKLILSELEKQVDLAAQNLRDKQK